MARMGAMFGSPAGLILARDQAGSARQQVAVACGGLPVEPGVARHRRNEGIARGLNEGLAQARLAGAAWLLTMTLNDPEKHLRFVFLFLTRSYSNQLLL